MRPHTSSLRVYLRTAIVFVVGVVGFAWVSGWFDFPHVQGQIRPQVSLDFTREQVARNARYRADLGPWPLLTLVTPVCVVAAVALTRLRYRFVRRAQRATWLSLPVQSGLLAAAVMVTAQVAAWPAAWAVESVDRQWGLSTMTAAAWLREQALDVTSTGSLVLVGSGLAAAAIRRWPGTWPFRLSWVAAALVLLATWFPVLRGVPGEHTRPLPTDSVGRAMSAVAERAGVDPGRVRVLDVSKETTQINAYASGVGPMTRVVVYDTLLKGQPIPQVNSVLAHELGHVHARDAAVMTVLSAGCAAVAVLALGLLWRRRRIGPTRLPFRLDDVPRIALAGMLAVLVSLPVTNGLSRKVEARADVYALELTRDPQAFVAVMRTIAVQGQSYLGDGAPRLWLRSHPTMAWRLAQARQWARDRGIDVPSPARDVGRPPSVASAQVR